MQLQCSSDKNNIELNIRNCHSMKIQRGGGGLLFKLLNYVMCINQFLGVWVTQYFY